MNGQLVTIVEIQKHPLNFCNSRQMDVIVETEDGTQITVPWAKIPHMGTIPYKPTAYFEWVWFSCEPGDTVYLYNGSDKNYNYIEPP